MDNVYDKCLYKVKMIQQKKELRQKSILCT